MEWKDRIRTGAGEARVADLPPHAAHSMTAERGLVVCSDSLKQDAATI